MIASNFEAFLVVLIADRFERDFYISKILHILRGQFSHFLLEDGEIEEIEEKLGWNLFGGKRFIHLRGLERQTTDLKLPFSSFPETILLFSGESCHHHSTIYPCFAENRAICLNFLHEKIWERKERYAYELYHIAQNRQKSVSHKIIFHFMAHVGLHFPRLFYEWEKLLLFVGSRNVVQESDFFQLFFPTHSEKSLWQITESLVWGHERSDVVRLAFHDLSELLSCFGLMRYHLYMGLEVFHHREQPEQKMSIHPARLQRYLAFCQKERIETFIQKLSLIFEWEIFAKRSHLAPTNIWNLFIVYYDSLSFA